MSRESIEAKAARYLGEGRLDVVYVREHPARISARCRGGESAVYDVDLVDGAWSCTCPARVPDCAHVTALKLVTPDPKETHVVVR